ncbi:MAG: phosphate ABC transporter substrate-binding protein [Methanobacteriaceae archaeon]|jgi:phosphate transport system substrate-binding protein|nr:phosphate ABC transporter substrate-binding protein [Candidatus Methanorudis spinitermitis]
MDSKLKVVIIIFLVVGFVYFVINPGSTYERIDIVGSTSVQPLAEKLANAFMENRPDIRINVQGGGSGMGIRSTQQGIVDIGMSSKELSSDEKKDITVIEIGKEGIVVGVNNKNNVFDLTIEQIRDIFNGKIKNWKELGGPDLEIHVITREEGSGTRSAFESIVMGDTEIKSDAVVQSSTESVKQSVASDPGAIGFVSLAHMSNDIKALLVEGVEPSDVTVANGEYLLQRPFLFLVKGENTPVLQEFLDWIKSPAGIKIIKNENIVPN